MIDNYLVDCHIVQLTAFNQLRIVSIYYNQQTVFRKILYRLLRSNQKIRNFAVKSFNKTSCKIFYRIHHKVCFPSGLSYCSCKSCSGAYSVQIGKPVSHYINIVAVMYQFLYRIRNDTRLSSGFFFNSVGNSAEKSESVFCFNRRLISASSQTHIQRLLCKRFALFKSRGSSADSY